MNTLFTVLNKPTPVILDGALATELERRGADLKDPLWSAKLLIEDPCLIRQVHLDYLRAGADVITSASYQATFEGFAQRGIEQEQAAHLMRLSVQLAQEAREVWRSEGRGAGSELALSRVEEGRSVSLSNRPPLAPRPSPLIAASIGPYGAYLHDGSEYRGDYGLRVEQLIDFHRPRMRVLAQSEADLLACETIPSLVEGEALVRLLAEFPGVYAWLSFSCKDGLHVCHGEPFADCVALANRSAQIVAVGVNCTPPQYVESLLRSAQGVTSKPLLAYPNSGETWDATHQCWLPGDEAGDFATMATTWLAAGARWIGGCCRTTPEDIRKLSDE